MRSHRIRWEREKIPYNIVLKDIAYKPSLAGEGLGRLHGCRSYCREEESNNSLLQNYFSLFLKAKRIYFNISSPQPSPAGEGLRARPLSLS